MSDQLAFGVLDAARDLGLSVPDDLSVVGFDDVPEARKTDPPLTTVHQPVRAKGQEAARMILTALGAREGEVGRTVVLETRLVIRESTAPPPVQQREEVRPEH